MTIAAGISNHASAGEFTTPRKLQAKAASGESDNAASSNSATISANDFLTLLVTELQNQDPTAQTDPNEYVNQLVAVNSLEQLININQTLGTALGGGTSGTIARPVADGTVAKSSAPTPESALTAEFGADAPGNLTIPKSHPAALEIAQALSGRVR